MISSSFTEGRIEPVSHNDNIQKRVLLAYGECANITQLARSIFPPGEMVESHCHPDMLEVFMVRSGRGSITVNGQQMELDRDTCIVIEAGEKHELANTGSDNLVIDYFGLEIENGS